MSFGRPPTFSTFTPTPPDRGSFPLDHEGECKEAMKEYMACMKSNKREMSKCRNEGKRYLECRMQRGLMEKDEMTNLGFHDTVQAQAQTQASASAQNASATTAATTTHSTNDPSNTHHPTAPQQQSNQRLV